MADLLIEVRVSVDLKDGGRHSETVALTEVSSDRPVSEQMAQTLRSVADELEQTKSRGGEKGGLHLVR
jgi:hypothetical protein